jgi:glycosyltransferase involved in cell wall biosynthesis
VVVADNCTDNTVEIVSKYTAQYNWTTALDVKSSNEHLPGRKVINAFNQGFESLDDNFDIICKFDADIILPLNYFERIRSIFRDDNSIGMASGLLYIERNKEWVYENIASKDHVRGPIKAYRKKCFKDIGGLRSAIGWDTIDVLLALKTNWRIQTDESLKVKHLKVTGKAYDRQSKLISGERWYNMRYGFPLTLIASLKSAVQAKNFSLFMNSMRGYFKAKRMNKTPEVSIEEGKFIRKIRWQNMRKKYLKF